MGSISKQVTIASAPEAVFKFVADPRNAPRYISSIPSIVSGPDGSPTVGQSWRAEANFLGRRSLITLRLRELLPNQEVGFAIEGDPAATLTMSLTPHAGGKQTVVSLHMDVPSVPGIFLNGLLGGLLGEDLARLKKILE